MQGKTIQAITFLLQVHKDAIKNGNKQKNKYLIIVPPSTLGNWQRELEKWSPNGDNVIYISDEDESKGKVDDDEMKEEDGGDSGENERGSDRGSEDAYIDNNKKDENVEHKEESEGEEDELEEEEEEEEEEAEEEEKHKMSGEKKIGLRVLYYGGLQKDRANLASSNKSGDFDVLLTTMLMFDKDSNTDDRAYFRKFKWNYVVIDEAHNIKSIKSNRFERLMKLKTQHKVLLTGTPVQNNLTELFSLLSYTFPNIFSEENPALMKLFEGNSRTQESAYFKKQLERVRKMLTPFILRRLKVDVLNELVAKKTEVKKLDMNPSQKGINLFYSKLYF